MDRNRIRPEFWQGIGMFIDSVQSYVNDSDENVFNLSELAIDDVKQFVSKYDYHALNGALALDANLEDYYNASLELHDIGLIGFTPFTSEMFDES